MRHLSWVEGDRQGSQKCVELAEIKNTYETGVCGISSSSSAAGTGVSWLEFRRPRFRRRDPIRSDCRNDWRALSTDIKNKNNYSICSCNIKQSEVNDSKDQKAIFDTTRINVCLIKLTQMYQSLGHADEVEKFSSFLNNG